MRIPFTTWLLAPAARLEPAEAHDKFCDQITGCGPAATAWCRSREKIPSYITTSTVKETHTVYNATTTAFQLGDPLVVTATVTSVPTISTCRAPKPSVVSIISAVGYHQEKRATLEKGPGCLQKKGTRAQHAACLCFSLRPTTETVLVTSIVKTVTLTSTTTQSVAQQPSVVVTTITTARRVHALLIGPLNLFAIGGPNGKHGTENRYLQAIQSKSPGVNKKSPTLRFAMQQVGSERVVFNNETGRMTGVGGSIDGKTAAFLKYFDTLTGQTEVQMADPLAEGMLPLKCEITVDEATGTCPVQCRTQGKPASGEGERWVQAPDGELNEGQRIELFGVSPRV